MIVGPDSHDHNFLFEPKDQPIIMVLAELKGLRTGKKLHIKSRKPFGNTESLNLWTV